MIAQRDALVLDWDAATQLYVIRHAVSGRCWWFAVVTRAEAVAWLDRLIVQEYRGGQATRCYFCDAVVRRQPARAVRACTACRRAGKLSNWHLRHSPAAQDRKREYQRRWYAAAKDTPWYRRARAVREGVRQRRIRTDPRFTDRHERLVSRRRERHHERMQDHAYRAARVDYNRTYRARRRTAAQARLDALLGRQQPAA